MSDRDIVVELQTQNAELLETLADVINQACSNPRTRWFDANGALVEGPEEELDSMALSAYADAMRLLADHGRLVIIDQAGRRVIAKWVRDE